MIGGCPAPLPDAPIVRSLMDTVDCNVRTLSHDGYATLFAPTGGFGDVLTVVLTIYVAVIGFQLMLGRTQLRVSDFAVTAVSLGAVLALATQWDTYQAVVYRLLFDGPRQLAAYVLTGIQPAQSLLRGDVFDGLQRAFDDLTAFATGYAAHSPTNANPLMGGAALGALLLTAAGSTLLLSTLGVILACKIVLGLLLALGPLFIVMVLFDATRGVFEGWLRAALAFAFAPLLAILLLGVILVMLEPSLAQIEDASARGVFILAPAYSVIVLIIVFVGVMGGALIATGMVAGGFRLPRRSGATTNSRDSERFASTRVERDTATQSRVAGTAAAVAAMERREGLVLGGGNSSIMERRVSVGGAGGSREAASGAAATQGQAPVRLGQETRRASRPRTLRTAAGPGGLR